MFLIPPEELARKNLEAKARRQGITEEDYKIDIRDLDEEQRVVSGIHDVYGKLFHELGVTTGLSRTPPETRQV